MKRRNFISGLGLTALFPFAAVAQQRPVRIGWVTAAVAAEVNPFVAGLRAGLAEKGYVEGRNLTIVERYGDGDLARVPAMADELMKLQVDVIATQGPATRLLQPISASVPVVYVYSADPIIGGIADTLARPGRNMTGVVLMMVELNGKRIELLRELAPEIGRIAIVASPTHPGEALERNNSEEMTRKLGIAMQYYPTPNLADLRRALDAIKADPPQAIVLFPDPVTLTNRSEIAAVAASLRIPVVSGWAEYADAGALVTYGPRLPESYKRLAYYVDRILHGAKPAELPIEQPTAFELVLNLKTAKALGITVAPALLGRADRVIE